MYDNHPDNPTPPTVKLPDKYNFVAWVQMRDFIFEEGDWTFYGMLAHNPGTDDYVLAIRGTSDPTEWWDDLTSMVPWQWEAFGGDVGYGFFRIYQTLRMIAPLKGQALTEAAPAGQGESLEAAGSFADQVAEAVRRHASAAKRFKTCGQSLSASSNPSGCRPGKRYATQHQARTKFSAGSSASGCFKASRNSRPALCKRFGM